MKSRFHRLLTFLVFGVAASAVNAQTESSDDVRTAAKHCTIGDVSAALEAFQIGLLYAGPFPTDIKIAGLGGSVNCQFRFFFPQKPTNGERWTFCEDDVFLGGVVWSWDYANFGVSRQYAVEDLEKYDSTVRFGPSGSALSEQSLVRTAYRDVIDPNLGRVVSFQEAFITQEEPGTYVSDWTAFYMGSAFTNAVVEIDVVSHEEHLHRVENGTWHTW